jgi:hypothetical protein
MPPTYLLPVITTKEQIGLSNVTNDLQLKKISNLEDITDVSVARSNLGLGNSATKDVGTGVCDVASGDHDHEGTYAPVLGEDDNYVTDAEKTKLSNLSGVNTGDQDLSNYSPITHTHIEDDVTDLDKYSQSEIDLMLQRLKGIDLTPNQLQYMYNHNTKLIATCEADEAWTDGNYIGTYVATHADDTTNNKVGTQGISITTTSTIYRSIHLEISKDLSEFEDGSESTVDDYIEFSIYCADASKVSNSSIIFRDVTGDVWYPSADLTIEDGWNHYQIQKSAFISDPIWSDTKHLEFTITSADGTEVSYTIDAIRMTRKDPISANPNPFQIENDGVMERVLEVSSGTPFLGYDGTTLCVKGMEVLVTLTNTSYNNAYVNTSGITNTSGIGQIEYFEDNNNRSSIYFSSDAIQARMTYGGSNSSETKAFAVNADDEVTIVGSIGRYSASANISKSGSNECAYINDGNVLSANAQLRLVLLEGASLTSFKCSSSPLMVNQ